MSTNKQLFPIVAIIPSLNPDDKLPEVVKGLFANGFSDVLLVDDGSRSECQPIFDQLEQLDGCTVIHHDVNKGKGRALKTAFSYYLEHYDLAFYKGVITADADGQHLPEDILATAQALCDKEHYMTLGTRNFNEKQVPTKSRLGNKITTFVFKLLYGKKINDTQTGLRGITNDFVKDCLEFSGERFEYEINMLIEAVQKKVVMEEVIIQTVYFNNNRETHFNTTKDSFRIYSVMFASFFRFAFSALFSTLVDQTLFALLENLVFKALDSVMTIPLSTVIARVGSSVLNFSLNRSFVFKSSNHSLSTWVRYYMLCTVQMIVSAIAVTVLHMMTDVNTTIIKIIVDTILFFISYQIQRNWIFREKKKD